MIPLIDVGCADPAWQYDDRNANGERGASFKYGVMSTEALCRLDVAPLFARDAVLFLWAVSPMLPDAFRVGAAWGFEYKTVGFTWVKTNRDGTPFTGLGHYTRANPEMCLLFTRGKRLERADRGVRQLVEAPVDPADLDAWATEVVYAQRREHSRKPDEVMARIERLYPSAVKLEMFARQRRPGWMAHGNQVPGGSDVEIPMRATQGVLL